ncbi:MAG: sensor histidine kinase [Candidatus Saccharimonadales bacterium]
MLIGKLSRQLNSNARLEHSRLTSLINSMADGVIAVDGLCQIVLYNGASLNILDRNESMENKSLSDVLYFFDKNDKKVDIVKLVKTTTAPTVNRDFIIKYNDGSAINIYLSVAPVRLGYGEVGQRGYVILIRDITREKSLEEERDEFISVVSHELRTPIAITEGNVSNAQFIVEKDGDIKDIKKALGVAHDQVLFLADLVNDLATLARAERGKLPLDIEPINVHELIGELSKSYQNDAGAKGLKLTTDIDPAVTILNSSKLYVREILQNFVTNSLKYTEKGLINLIVRNIQNGIIVKVQDTGIGISRSDQKRVFDKFFRSEDFRTRKTNGTGLGLYVSDKLAKILEASISLESDLDKGSTFIISLPNLEIKKAETK